MLEVDVKVVEHHANDDKNSFAIVLKGITGELAIYKVKVESGNADLLKLFPRGASYTLNLTTCKQTEIFKPKPLKQEGAE